MDGNFRHHGEPLNPQEYYNNTYSLWQNSRFYDTNNLSPQNYNSNQWSTPTDFANDKPSDVKKDAKNRRLITRESLYEDPESFYEKYKSQQRSGYDWTKLHWTKAQESTLEGPSEGPCTSNQGQQSNLTQYQRTNKIQKNLDEMLERPVKLTKAESMMQKMGWQGGALGKSGSGIVEPIKPNANYAVKTLGFGQSHVPRVKKMKAVDNNKNVFTTNVLLYILEFVKDDMEVEILFDSCLWKEERKWIHSIVNDIINADAADCDTVDQMDIVQQIYEHNCFVLATQSEGQVPNRQLCLYKEAPPNMYLITPSDLRDEPEEEEEEHMETDEQTDEPDKTKSENQSDKAQTDKKIEKQNVKIPDAEVKQPDKRIYEPDKQASKQPDVQPNSMDVETNPFLRSITRNLTNEKENNLSSQFEICTLQEEVCIFKKIVEYFQEFAEQEIFTEMRFLGPFSDDEVSDVNKFMDSVKKCVSGDFEGAGDDMVAVFKDRCFDIHEDVNGFTVIYRIQNTA